MALVLDTKIVGWKLGKVEKPSKEGAFRAMPRPTVLAGETYKIKLDTGDGVKNAYVTVSFFPDTRKPYEVFINSPVSNNMKDLQILELSARMTSLALRHGIPAEFVSDQLSKTDGQYIYSIPATLSNILQNYIEFEDEEEDEVEDPKETKPQKIKGTKCPQCGEMQYIAQGACGECLACTYTKCG